MRVMTFDEALYEAHNKGYYVSYANDCQYPCLIVRVGNGVKQIDRMIEQYDLVNEHNVAHMIKDMIAELEKPHVEGN